MKSHPVAAETASASSLVFILVLNLQVPTESSNCIRPLVWATSLETWMGFAGPWASGPMALVCVSIVPVLETQVSNISAHRVLWSWPLGVFPFIV